MDIPTPLYREGWLFFLPDEYFSFTTDKIWERGEGEICDIIQIFFNNHSDLSLLESGRSADIILCPLSPNMMGEGRSP